MKSKQRAIITYLTDNSDSSLYQTADEFNQPSGWYATNENSDLLTESEVRELVLAGKIRLQRNHCYVLVNHSD
ncbi:MAG: hypothetical protein V4628_05185 [Pseudomonadota bacterium]